MEIATTVNIISGDNVLEDLCSSSQKGIHSQLWKEFYWKSKIKSYSLGLRQIDMRFIWLD